MTLPIEVRQHRPNWVDTDEPLKRGELRQLQAPTGVDWVDQWISDGWTLSIEDTYVMARGKNDQYWVVAHVVKP